MLFLYDCIVKKIYVRENRKVTHLKYNTYHCEYVFYRTKNNNLKQNMHVLQIIEPIN